MAGKHPKARGGAKGGKKFESKKRVRREKVDESDREEEQAREEVAEMQQQATERDFEVFSSGSEEDEESVVGQEAHESDDHESEVDVAPEFDINGEYFSTLLKDLRLYDLRLGKLKTLLSSVSLTEGGREFIKSYHDLVSVYCAYLMFYTYLTSQKGITFHPVLRQLASMRTQVKAMDKEYAKHKITATALIEQIEAGGLRNIDEEGEEEEGLYEGMDEEDFDGLEESEDTPQVYTKPSVVEKSKKKSGNNGKLKQKVQVFKLDQPRSYSDVHQYVPFEEDEDDNLLNLADNSNRQESNSGEITMADFNAYQNNLGFQKSKKLPSKKGKQLYQEIAEAKDQSNARAAAVKDQTQTTLDEYERKLMFNERKIKADQPRTLSEDMLLNRGLKQKRKNVISKVKLRRKYEKAKLQDRVRKGLRLDDGNVRDIHMIRGTGEGVVRDIALN